MKKIYYSLVKLDKDYSFNLPINIINHVSKYDNDEQRKISSLGYHFLGELIKNISQKDLLKDIYFSNNGKPLLDNYYVSLSHKKDYVIVSFSLINHGVDIEEMKENYNPRIIKKIMNIDVSSKDEFYKLWTSKEVMVKCEDSSLFNNIDIEDYNIISFNIDNFMISIGSKEEFEISEIKL